MHYMPHTSSLQLCYMLELRIFFIDSHKRVQREAMGESLCFRGEFERDIQRNGMQKWKRKLGKNHKQCRVCCGEGRQKKLLDKNQKVLSKGRRK